MTLVYVSDNCIYAEGVPYVLQLVRQNCLVLSEITQELQTDVKVFTFCNSSLRTIVSHKQLCVMSVCITQFIVMSSVVLTQHIMYIVIFTDSSKK